MKMIESQETVARLLSRQELADRLGVSVATVRREEAAGRLTFVRIGRQVRFREADVRAYLETAATKA